MGDWIQEPADQRVGGRKRAVDNEGVCVAAVLSGPQVPKQLTNTCPVELNPGFFSAGDATVQAYREELAEVAPQATGTSEHTSFGLRLAVGGLKNCGRRS